MVVLDRQFERHGHAADRVDDRLERAEVDLDVVVDLDAEVVEQRLGEQRVVALAVGRVDPRPAVAGNLDPQVAGERQDRRPLLGRVDAHEHDRVAALADVTALRIGGAGVDRVRVHAGVAVVADDEEVLRRGIGRWERHVRVADEHAVGVHRDALGADHRGLRRSLHRLAHPLADDEGDGPGEAGDDDEDVERRARLAASGVAPGRNGTFGRSRGWNVGSCSDVIDGSCSGRGGIAGSSKGSDIADPRYWRTPDNLRHPSTEAAGDQRPASERSRRRRARAVLTDRGHDVEAGDAGDAAAAVGGRAGVVQAGDRRAEVGVQPGAGRMWNSCPADSSPWKMLPPTRP